MSIDDKQKPSSKDSSDSDILSEIEKFCDLAYSCDAEKDYQGAINNFTKAIDLDSEDGSLYACRAESKEKLEDYLGVIEDTTMAIALHKEEYFYLKSRLYLIRSNAKKKLGEHKGYLEDLAKEKESKTNEDTEKFNNLADSFFENKDYKSAIENYTKAIDINTNDPLLYLYRGQSKSELKDYLGALSDYSKAIELEPEDGFIYESIGNVYSEMKDYKKAIQAFTTSIEKDFCPSFYLYVHRAIAKKELNDYEGEIEDLTKAIESLNEDEYILKTGLFEKRGKAREKLGDIKGSIDDFKKEKEISEKGLTNLFQS